jgi:hypothetical protein
VRAFGIVEKYYLKTLRRAVECDADELQECQAKGWSERGHKGECNVFKAVGEIFGKE